MPVRIEFDPAKSERNARSRGLSFELAAGFDWESAVYREDSGRAYPEGRIVALGYVGPRLCVLCFTPIEGGVRIISFRKANAREIKRYAEETTHR